MKILITGGCGFLGSNIAKKAIDLSYEVIIIDNLSKVGSLGNLMWLRGCGDFSFYSVDVKDSVAISTIIKDDQPDVLVHLAGQVSMLVSLENPSLDFNTNVVGTFNLLESVRKYSPETIVLYSSSNKVYGDLEYLNYTESDTRYTCDEFPNGFNETLPLDFTTPYGCSKGAADRYLLDYHKMYGIRTVVFRHSAMYGGRQFANYSQGWIGWFTQKAVEKFDNNKCDKYTISGSGKQVRDVLYCDDIVKLYFMTIKNIDKTAGKVYNIGGGISNSLSLLELFSLLESELNIVLEYEILEERKSDQKFFVADIDHVKNDTGWSPIITKEEGIKRNIDWVKYLNKLKN